MKKCNSNNFLKKITLKVVIFLGLLVSSLFINLVKVQAEEKEYQISSVNIQAELKTDGSMEVTETRTYNFTGDFRFAYQRINLKPDQKTDPGRSESYRVRIKSLCDEKTCYKFVEPNKIDLTERRNNQPGTYTVIYNNDEVYIQWHYATVNGSKVFKLNYLVDNAVTLHEDVAELYWQFVGSEWEVAQKNITVDLNLPDGISGDDIEAWGHGE
ncbi:MAG: DUF2207 domain-containing protein, partial [Candidatus Pacebacteria bacterium]|nr:DUF2207 domain-containing protein [Candidatus Paceibacterota bacterium]